MKKIKAIKATKCQECGKEITYKTLGGTVYPLDTNEVDFVPDNSESNSKVFVNRKGIVFKGHRVNDGQHGYKVHDCQKVYAGGKPLVSVE